MRVTAGTPTACCSRTGCGGAITAARGASPAARATAARRRGDAALREAVEETGIDPARVRLTGDTVDDHGGWSYVTVHARLETDVPPALEPTDGEATELRWTPVEQVSDLPLHPGFAQFWAGPDALRTPTVNPWRPLLPTPATSSVSTPT